MRADRVHRATGPRQPVRAPSFSQNSRPALHPVRMGELRFLSPEQYLELGLETLGIRATMTRTAAGVTIELADRASEQALVQVVEVVAAQLRQIRTGDTETLAELLPRAADSVRRASLRGREARSESDDG